MLEPRPLETVVAVLHDGVRFTLRGSLSADTAPALASLLDALERGGDERIVLDVRHAEVEEPIDLVLRGWRARAGALAGTYDLTSEW